MTSLAERYDALLLDLDGTVYLGHQPIEHVGAALQEAARRGARSVYITNNASRPPAEVAAQLVGMGLEASPDDVLTSPQAAATMLVDQHPAGARVLVVGAPYLADEVERRGLTPVRTFAENPVAVVQGHSPETGWSILAEACLALRSGADWVAANVDATLPTDRGLLPGNGAMVSVLITATGRHPRVAGKPARPMIDTAIARYGSTSPLVVGDRLDTDIEAAVTAGVPSLLVFTGVSTPAEVIGAPASRRPVHLGFDMRAVIDADRAVDITTGGAGWRVEVSGDGLRLARDTSSLRDGTHPDADALHALAALAQVSWAATDEPTGGVTAADEVAGAALVRLGLGTS
ncbi:MAG: HAD-IIA family hydrolase [Nakamurella sp.]